MKSIVFSGNEGANGYNDLYLIDTDGTNKRKVTTATTTAVLTAPTF